MKHLALAVALALLSPACSRHALMRDQIVMKVSATEAHVCLRPGSFAVGDRVRVFELACVPGAVERGVECQRRPIGEGRVTRVLNEHYAAVELAVPFEEGFGIEVIR
jgi:hypothetical protein